MQTIAQNEEMIIVYYLHKANRLKASFMKKGVFLFIILVLMCGTTMAEPLGYGIALGYGDADGMIDVDIGIYRMGMKQSFSSKWFETSYGHLSGYFELSYNQWEYDSHSIVAIGFSPVFAYYFGNPPNAVIPYIEAGIGIAYLDEYHIALRNLSSHWQFEDRIGVGARIGLVDLNFRYLHYSNANLKLPNHGIDIWIFTTAYHF